MSAYKLVANQLTEIYHKCSEYLAINFSCLYKEHEIYKKKEQLIGIQIPASKCKRHALKNDGNNFKSHSQRN